MSDMKTVCWSVYLLRCKDGSLYCGITNDLKARLKKHNDGTGAKYTRGRGPVELVWKKKMKTATDARKKEAEIKKLKKEEKERMIKAPGGAFTGGKGEVI